MAVPAGTMWKLDDGSSFAVNCFPARGISRSTHDGAGSWIVAYTHEKQQKFKSVFKLADQEGESFAATQTTEKDTAGTQKEFNNILTGDFLVSHHHVDSPDDLCSVNITDCDLEFAEKNDFAKFTNIAYVNAAENLLTVRPFSTFPNLRELELPVNGVRNIGIQHGDFPTLQVLDLSYNNLSPNDFLSLGSLPKLKVLTLTGNGLSQIHPDLCQPYAVQDNINETVTRFQNLEVLMLDDNHLHDMAAFAALAALPSLKELNLDKNDITLVPYLRVIGEKVLSEMHSVSQPTTASEKRGASRSSSRKKGHRSKETLNPAPLKLATDISHQRQEQDEVISMQIEDKTTAIDTDLSFDASGSTPPFQHLRILSLANNRISEEEHLLAVAAWPTLQALILHGNPLVTNNKGEPPLLSHYLSKRLGISIFRFKPRAPVSKPMLQMPTDKKRRISSRVPRIPKQPVDIMLKALRKPAIGHIPHPPDQPNLPKEDVTDRVPQQQGSADKDSDQDNVFLTQVQDEDFGHAPLEPKDDGGVKDREEEGSEETKPSFETIEEILQDAKPDPDIHENLSIQGNVKMLRQILQHPLSVSTVDPDPAHRLRKLKYRDRATITVDKLHQDVRTQPRPDAKLLRRKKLDETLSWMRDKPVVAVELPLIDALNQTKDKKLRSEADALLNQIEVKYRVARAESLRAAKQAQQAIEKTKEEFKNMQKYMNKQL